jgi:phospholipid/cholesterol/gamma-HCH transport system substrate-binding protein
VSERGTKIRLGLFVLLALGILASMIVLFGSLPTLFQRSNLYTVRFTDAPGVTPGTPVRRSGVRIGAVRDVTLDDERGFVRVLVGIDPRFSLRRGDQATLITGLLGSDASIDFVPQPPEEGQPPDREPLQPGSEVVGVRSATVNTLLNRASEAVPTTQETMNEMRKSLQRLEKMAPLAEDSLREYRDLARDVRNAIPDLKKTNDAVQKAIPDLRRTAEDFGAASRMWTRVGERADLWLQTNQDKLTKSVENLNEVLARAVNLLSEENQRNVSAIIKNVRVASDRLDEISRNLDEILREGRKITARLGDTLTRLDAILTDTQKITKPLAERMETITRNLDEVLANTQKITKPLAERAEPIARNLDATLADAKRLTGPFADRSDRLSRDLEQSLDRLNHLLGDFNALMRVLDQCDSTLRRFLTDPSLYIHLDEAVCGVGKLTPQISRILKDFETFADKLARHPEAIGLGGVVRPGSGLKGPPTPPQIPP